MAKPAGTPIDAVLEPVSGQGAAARFNLVFKTHAFEN